MPAAYLYAPTASPASARRRTAAFALAIAAHLLLLALLLRLPPNTPRFVEVKPPSSFQLLPDAPAAAPVPAPRPRPIAKASKPAAATPPAAAPPAPAAAAPPPPPLPQPQATPAPSLFGNPDLFQSADIGKMHGHAADADSGAGTGKESASVYGPGEGPGGQRLYDVEWYREPTNAELAFYMPPAGAPPGSWATVACRMVADYHVENCRALSESPVGSGLARAMRQAAWQFLVRPPRIGSRALIGSWVRIRIDFSEKPAATK